MLQPNDSLQTNNSEASTTTSLQPMGFTDILDTIFWIQYSVSIETIFD